jgi:hypothetical protein
MPDFYWRRFGGGANMSLHTYRVEFFETASQLPNALWDACFQLPAEGRWWYETLDQSGIEDQFTFFYGLIEHLGRPVGIAPGFVMDLPVEQVAPKEFLRLLRLVGKIVPSVLCQRTVFVGSPVLDESRVGLLTHVNRRNALLSLQVALEKKAHELRAPLIVWKDFPESSSADLNWLSHERRLFRVISFPNTIVEFPSHRKEDYFAAMKGTRRRNLKKRLSLSREQVALGVEIVQCPDAKTLDDIFKLFWQTYEKSATKFERLNRKFFEVISGPLTMEEKPRDKATNQIIPCHSWRASPDCNLGHPIGKRLEQDETTRKNVRDCLPGNSPLRNTEHDLQNGLIFFAVQERSEREMRFVDFMQISHGRYESR